MSFIIFIMTNFKWKHTCPSAGWRSTAGSARAAILFSNMLRVSSRQGEETHAGEEIRWEQEKGGIYEVKNIRASSLELSLTSKQKRRVCIWCGVTLSDQIEFKWILTVQEAAGHRGETESVTFPLHKQKKTNNSHKSSGLMKVELFIYSFIASVYWIGGKRPQYHLHPVPVGLLLQAKKMTEVTLQGLRFRSLMVS